MAHKGLNLGPGLANGQRRCQRNENITLPMELSSNPRRILTLAHSFPKLYLYISTYGIIFEHKGLNLPPQPQPTTTIVTLAYSFPKLHTYQQMELSSNPQSQRSGTQAECQPWSRVAQTSSAKKSRWLFCLFIHHENTYFTTIWLCLSYYKKRK